MISRLLEELREHPEVAERLDRAAGGRPLHSLQLSSRWEGRNVWAVFAGRQRHPVLIVKADHFSRYKRRLHRELEALLALARRPELRGSVPEPLALFESGPRLVLAQSGMPGKSLSVVIRRRLKTTPRASARDHRRILHWLNDFRQDGLEATPLSLPADLVIDRAASVLEGEHPAFLTHLSSLAAGWDKLELPLLPGHGDLGPSNCLVDGEHVSIIDWEGGLGRRHPITDILIFLNHYGRSHQPSGPRQARWDKAFRRVFMSDHWLADLTADSFLTQLDRLGLPVAAGEYLLASTLAELASGESAAAHAGAADKYWRPFFHIYAAAHKELRVRQVLAARTPRS